MVVKLQDDIKVHPSDLGKPRAQAISAVLEKLYLDKVIADVGLVITLYDILSIGDGQIYHSEGSATFQVVFRLVVFRPAEGEVITGTVAKSVPEGLHVSLGFFHDVFIPEHFLQQPSAYVDDQEQGQSVWRWDFDGTQMFMDAGEPIRVCVREVTFLPRPTPLELHQARLEGNTGAVGTATNPYVPMRVVGEICGDGLGLVSWWAQAEVQADGDQMEQDGE